MNKMALVQSAAHKVFLAALLASLASCASLLPDAKQETRTPWASYAEAQAMFEKIVPGKTTLAELKALGVDPDQTPNVALLGHADLLRRLVASSSFDISQLDPGLQQCVSSATSCFGYELEQTLVDRKRIGGFWMDFLNFRRQVDITGWQFDAIVVIKSDVVIYKLWSGKPKIHQAEDERNPLGPLQGIGPSTIHF
jgi:hypothetical protein